MSVSAPSASQVTPDIDVCENPYTEAAFSTEKINARGLPVAAGRT